MENEPDFKDVIEMMALLHKQNMEMLDRIITLKTIDGVKNEIPTDTTTDAER